jgi:trypsin-like peptidase
VAFLFLGSLAAISAARPQDNPGADQLPPELHGAKIYKFPENTEPGKPVDSPVFYKSISYDDIHTDRLLLNLFVGIKPADRSATIRRIYFQDVRVGGVPVHIETFEKEFKVSNKDAVDLPAPLKCSVVFTDLESLEPLKELVNKKTIQITGESFIEVKLNFLEKLVLGAKQLVLPVKVDEEIPLEFLPDSPFMQMAANKILDTLSDPTAPSAIALAKEHVAQLEAEHTLATIGINSLYLIYCEYTLRNPQTKATQNFVQSGTGFVVSPDGKLLTAKRVIQPWKFDPQVALLMKRFHLEFDARSYKLSAWPAGAQVLLPDGKFDFQTAASTDRQTLKVLKTAPDQIKKQNYRDPESGASATLDLDAPGSDDAALLQLSGTRFVPLTIADPSVQSGQDNKTALLSFPYGLIQPIAVPKLTFVKTTVAGSLIMLDQPLNTGESGAPLLTTDGKVLAFAGGAKDCIPIAAIRNLLSP